MGDVIAWSKLNKITKMVKNLPTSLATNFGEVKDSIGGLVSNFNTWKADWTSGRAAKIDNLDVASSTLAKDATVAKANDLATVAKSSELSTLAKSSDIESTKQILTTFGNKIYIDNSTSIIEPNDFNDAFKMETSEFRLNSVDTIGYGAFDGFRFLKKIEAPNCTTIQSDYVTGRMPFRGCSSLKYLKFDNVTNLGRASFSSASGLETVDLPKCTSIPSFIFDEDNLNLKSFVLRANKVCALSDGLVNGTLPSLSVYVPDNLVNSYKRASNWKAIANQIKPLSQYRG